jgi:hypothetical protein
MRRNMPTAVALALALLVDVVPLAAEETTTASELRAEAQEAWQDLKAATADERQAAVEAGRDVVSAIDRQLAELARAAEASGEAASEAWRERRAELVALRDEVAAEVDRLAAASDEAWAEAKDRVAAAYEASGEGLAEAWDALSGEDAS